MYIYQIERDLLRQNIFQKKGFLGGRVLDVGSGSEKKYLNIVRKDSEYITLDIKPSSGVDIVGSAETIPVDSNSFDSIICTQVLGDILYPQKALKEFQRVLKKGGRIILTEGFMNEIHGEPVDFWRFTPFGLKNIFEDNGFRVLESKIIGGFFSVILQMIIRFFINSLNLYNHKFIGKIFSKTFFCLGKITIFIEKVFAFKAIRKFGLDIIVVAEKI